MGGLFPAFITAFVVAHAREFTSPDRLNLHDPIDVAHQIVFEAEARVGANSLPILVVLHLVGAAAIFEWVGQFCSHVHDLMFAKLFNFN